jgi:hypothetical protein
LGKLSQLFSFKRNSKTDISSFPLEIIFEFISSHYRSSQQKKNKAFCGVVYIILVLINAQE